MPNRSRKQPDANEAAFAVVAQTIEASEKNPAAVALGRRGGLKGGKARAKALSPEQRKQSAQDAANARWEHVRAAKAKAS
jgi:hypothetical protein